MDILISILMKKDDIMMDCKVLGVWWYIKVNYKVGIILILVWRMKKDSIVEAYERGIGNSRFGRKFDEEIVPYLRIEKL